MNLPSRGQNEPVTTGPSQVSQQQWIFAIGAWMALIAVAAGAFGAHGLRGRVEPPMLAVFETAARYQMYHAGALMIAALAATRWIGRLWSAAAIAFVIGILLFSGSLYLMVLTGNRALGWVTPLGGVAFLVGWAIMAVAALRLRPPR